MRIRRERGQLVKSTKPASGRHDNQFYRRTAWLNRRKAVLMDEPLCRICASVGLTVPATIVDHIVPRSLGGDDFAWHNLQPLCSTCHSIKTRKEQLLNVSNSVQKNEG